jgi:hypothetical protein
VQLTSTMLGRSSSTIATTEVEPRKPVRVCHQYMSEFLYSMPKNKKINNKILPLNLKQVLLRIQNRFLNQRPNWGFWQGTDRENEVV